MKTAIRRTWWLCALTALVALPAVGQDDKPKEDATQQAAVAPADSALRLRLEVLQLQLTEEQVYRINRAEQMLDVEALARETIKAGNARLSHLIDAPIVVGEEVDLTSGSRIPLVTGTRRSKSGETTTAVNYENVGCMLTGRTLWMDDPADGMVLFAGQIEIADVLHDTPVELAEGVAASVHTEVSQELRAFLRFGRPVCFSSLSSQRLTVSDQGTAHMLVWRLRVVAEEG